MTKYGNFYGKLWKILGNYCRIVTSECLWVLVYDFVQGSEGDRGCIPKSLHTPHTPEYPGVVLWSMWTCTTCSITGAFLFQDQMIMCRPLPKAC